VARFRPEHCSLLVHRSTTFVRPGYEGRNAIFCHVATLPQSTLRDKKPSYAKSSFQTADVQIQLGNVDPIVCLPSGPISSAATTFSGDKLSDKVTQGRRYAPSRLRANDDDLHNSCSFPRICCSYSDTERRIPELIRFLAVSLQET